MNREEAIYRTRAVLRRQHKALATEQAYLHWLGRYIQALRHIPDSFTSEQKLERFLTDLALNQNVSASTQNQAFNAIRAIPRLCAAPPERRAAGAREDSETE